MPGALMPTEEGPPMKVCVVGTRGFPGVQGGVETHCEHLYPRLAELGCEVTVFRRAPYVRDGRRSYRGVGLVDIWCPRLKTLEALMHTLLAVLAAARRRPDVLHVHCAGPALMTPLAKLLGLRVVFTSQGQGIDYRPRKWGPVARAVIRLGERLGVRCADRTVAVARHIARHIEECYGLSAELIPNGTDLPEPPQRADLLEEWGLEPGRYVFALGRFVPEKGFDDLLEAFAGLKTDWKLALAGDADHPTAYSRALKLRARRADGVVLTGFVTGEALAQLYAHCGLFVLPSYHEGLPLVLLEALSHGCSVVASDIPANRGLGLPEERFFPPGEVGTLRERMARWMERGISEGEREANLRMLRQRFSWGAIARRTLALYRQVARRPLPAPPQA